MKLVLQKGIHLAENGIQWRAAVKKRISWLCEQLVASQEQMRLKWSVW
jgi:hypothetical protein